VRVAMTVPEIMAAIVGRSGWVPCYPDVAGLAERPWSTLAGISPAHALVIHSSPGSANGASQHGVARRLVTMIGLDLPCSILPPGNSQSPGKSLS